MKILILHRIPYHKIEYHRGIDHQLHDVAYLGDEAALATIPTTLRCRRLVRRANAVNAMVACLQGLRGELDFDRIISHSEYELLLAAELRALLGVPGQRPASVHLVRDKVLMKAAVAACGIRVPRHIRIEGNWQAQITWQGPTVVKPVDGAASEGVQVFPSIGPAVAVAANLPGQQIEEYVGGPILHFDGLAEAGKAKFLVASRYIGTCLAFAQGQPLGSVQIGLTEVTEPLGAKAWVERCLAATEIASGAFHLEAIQTPTGLCFLEIGARVGGADVVECFELATGIHLPSEDLRLQIEGATTSAGRAPSCSFGWFVYPAHLLGPDGADVAGTARFRDHPAVRKWCENPGRGPSGVRVSYQANEAPLAGVASADDSKALTNFISDLFAWVAVRPREKELYRA